MSITKAGKPSCTNKIPNKNGTPQNLECAENNYPKKSNHLPDMLRHKKSKASKDFSAPDPANKECLKIKKIIDKAMHKKNFGIEPVIFDFSKIKLSNLDVFRELDRYDDLFEDGFGDYQIAFPNELKYQEREQFKNIANSKNKTFVLADPGVSDFVIHMKNSKELRATFHDFVTGKNNQEGKRNEIHRTITGANNPDGTTAQIYNHLIGRNNPDSKRSNFHEFLTGVNT